jgi:Synaptobrevin
MIQIAAIKKCTCIGTEMYFEMHSWNVLAVDGRLVARLLRGLAGRFSPLDFLCSAFACLETIAESFLKLYGAGRIKRATVRGMQKVFEPTIRSHMHHHNMNAKKLAYDSKVLQIQTQVVSVESAMGRNLDLLVRRGNALEKLHRQSVSLEQDAAIFKKKSKVLKRTQQQKYYCVSAGCLVVLLFVSYVLVVTFCGIGLTHCRPDDDDDEGNEGYTRFLAQISSWDTIISPESIQELNP